MRKLSTETFNGQIVPKVVFEMSIAIQNDRIINIHGLTHHTKESLRQPPPTWCPPNFSDHPFRHTNCIHRYQLCLLLSKSTYLKLQLKECKLENYKYQHGGVALFVAVKKHSRLFSSSLKGSYSTKYIYFQKIIIIVLSNFKNFEI